MKFKYLSLVLSSLLITACASNGSTDSAASATNTPPVVAQPVVVTAPDVGATTLAANEAASARTLSAQDVQTAAANAAQYDDQKTHATTTGAYGKRLLKVTSRIKTVEGFKLNYRVVNSSTPDIYGFADGSIRVTSALMNQLSDDELRFVISHEIGHVKLGHATNKMKVALATTAVHKGLSVTNNTISALLASEQAEYSNTFLSTAYSVGAEQEADDFAIALFKKYRFNTKVAVPTLQKLAKLGGGVPLNVIQPGAQDRAQRLHDALSAK